MKEKFKKAAMPKLNEQTMYQLNQIKAFVDNSLITVLSNQYKNDTEKIADLGKTLYNIRDFIMSATNENSVRIDLIKAFNQIESFEALGNDTQQQEEKLQSKTEERSVPDQPIE